VPTDTLYYGIAEPDVVGIFGNFAIFREISPCSSAESARITGVSQIIGNVAIAKCKISRK